MHRKPHSPEHERRMIFDPGAWKIRSTSPCVSASIFLPVSFPERDLRTMLKRCCGILVFPAGNLAWR
jgi:hypothetical protein